MSDIPSMHSIAEFLLDAPLYAKYSLSEDLDELRIIYRRESYNFDGHCPFCHKNANFHVNGISIPNGDPWNNIRQRHAHDSMSIQCSRNDDHKIYFLLKIHNMVIQKIGQFPSLADIANDESKEFRSVLRREDSMEFHKAIGLAAHGVGIGSFVYLRRIFERLIHDRFNLFKDTEGWKEEDFNCKRMDEKIELLKSHLPPFLVENKRIYSILSIGIHEMNEQDCLGFFDVLKSSIIIILTEAKRKQEEDMARAKLNKAIAAFSGNPSNRNP